MTLFVNKIYDLYLSRENLYWQRLYKTNETVKVSYRHSIIIYEKTGWMYYFITC